MRLLNQVAKQPIVGRARRRREAKRILQSMLDQRMVERSALHRAVIQRDHLRPVPCGAEAPPAGGRPEIHHHLTLGRLLTEDDVGFFDL